MSEAGNLIGRFGLDPGTVVAICGSGGKTTLMYRLASEAMGRGWKVLCSSTVAAQMAPTTPGRSVVVAEDLSGLEARLREAFAASEQVVLFGSEQRRDKLLGVPVEALGGICGARLADLVVLECCGARGRSFKAPASHEPVIPPFATHVVVVVGLDAVGRTMDGELVHRPERVTEITGLEMGGVLSPDVIARVVGAPECYTSKGPPEAVWFLYCTKATTPERRQAAGLLAELLVDTPFEVVVAD
jgi:probable selenium-dependent hydroxylase accessory protein YqeC